MDAAITGAITAVHLDDESAVQRWFEVICATHDEMTEAGETEWDRFAEALAEGADAAGVGRAVAEEFCQHVRRTESDPLDTIRRLREFGTDLPAWYRQLTTPDAAAAGSGGYEEAGWNAFLAANGPRWNGTDDSWTQFREWFAYEAAQQGFGEPANAFLTYAESEGDKAAVFAQYGIQVSGRNEADPGAYPALKEGDTGEWVDYLDAMLTSKGF
ncbi:MAG: hypothetical protein LC635_06370 [Pseudonocardiaceae bacterium]|nr:hypothetical protein [Pseudonocardiaceae bacterium]